MRIKLLSVTSLRSICRKIRSFFSYVNIGEPKDRERDRPLDGTRRARRGHDEDEERGGTYDSGMVILRYCNKLS